MYKPASPLMLKLIRVTVSTKQQATDLLVMRVYFALLRKILKPLSAHLPAILLDLLNRPSGETDFAHEIIVKWLPTRTWLISVQVNS